MLNTHKKMNLLYRSFMLLLMLAASLTASHVKAQTNLLKDFENHERENQRRREEYIEKIHRTAPGVDWRKMDESFRTKAYSEYKKHLQQSGQMKTAAVETIPLTNVTGEWIEKGSNNMAGRIRYADYWSATNTVYALSDGGNVWKADFNGTNWTCLNNGIKLKGAVFISVVPTSTGKRIIVGTEDKKIYYSDNETIWNESSGFANLQNEGRILKTVVLGNTARTVFVLAGESINGSKAVSIYRSTNQGTSFQKLKSTFTPDYDWNKYSLWAPAVSHTEAYVINQDSTFAISPTATTNAVTRLYKHNKIIHTNLRFTGGISGTTVIFYISTSTGPDTPTILYRSTTKGQTWTTLNIPDGGDPWGWYGLNISTASPGTIFWGNSELYKGILNGAATSVTWTKVNVWDEYYGSPATKLHADIPAVVSVKNASNAEYQLICTDGGLYTSTNTVTTVSNISLSGMNNSQYYSVYTLRNNPNYVYAGAQDQGIQLATADNGGLMSFTQLYSGDNGRTVSTDHNSVWQTSYGWLSYYSNGQDPNTFTWTGYPASLGKLWMPFLLEHPTDPAKVYFGGGRREPDTVNHIPGDLTASILVYSYNSSNGITMDSLPYDFAAPSGCNNISAIGISKLNNSYWYVLTDNGALFTSSSGGSNFTKNQSFSGLPGHYFYGSAIYPSRVQLGTVYLAGSGYDNPGVYKLINHGSSFEPMNNGLPSTMVFDITANDDESLLFAATEVGAYIYVVAQNSWYPMKGNYGPDQTYWDVEYISATKTARFATYGRGIWDFRIQTGTPGNISPVVSITAPANNYSTSAPANITVTANATDQDGTISKVEFFQGTSLIGTSIRGTNNPGPSYSIPWNNVAAGSYSLTAKAYDNLNATTVSLPVTVTVTSSNSCTGVATWVNNTSYTSGNIVQLNGIKYQATQWNYNQSPAVAGNTCPSGCVWKSLGSCTAKMASDILSLTPNPVDNLSLINIDIEEDDLVDVYVADHLGRRAAEVYKGKLAQGMHQFNMEAASITPGIYYLIMSGNKGNIAVRFIKK